MNKGKKPLIKILLVEDSAVQRELLNYILIKKSNLEVIAEAKDGLEAIKLLSYLKPDLILMDLHMPRMNGIEAITNIMAFQPIPIIAMSSTSDIDETVNGFQALEAGAVAFAQKPVSLQDPHFNSLCAYLLKTIQLMSEVKVVRHRIAKSVYEKKENDVLPIKVNTNHNDIKLIAIGASTGGPLVLQTILHHLPKSCPPILIVQHITPGFVLGLSEWLANSTGCKVCVAENNQLIKRGQVYLAPDHYNMGINNNRIALIPGDSKEKICPSINFLFHSVSIAYKNKAMGILLTGMGEDGAQQLKKMRDQGSVTIAQTKESSLIYGMPAQAVENGAALYSLDPLQINKLISSLTNQYDNIFY